VSNWTSYDNLKQLLSEFLTVKVRAKREKEKRTAGTGAGPQVEQLHYQASQ